jgi:GTP-binding protein
MINEYLEMRPTLVMVFLLIDVRLEPQKNDLDFLNWLGEQEIPFALIFTKADKLSKNKVQSQIAQYRKTLKKQWEELPPHFVTSSLDRLGKESVLEYINDVLDSLPV